MEFKVSKNSFLNIFTRSVYAKIVKESLVDRGNVSYKDFKNALNELYEKILVSNYNPKTPIAYVFLHKTQYVSRIIPILTLEDECFYYFICKILEDDIAINRVRNTFGGWRLGNEIKQKELDDIIEIEYSNGSYAPWLWSENWKEFVRISRMFSESGKFKYAFKLDIANFYDSINLNKLQLMLYQNVQKERQWAIPYLFHFLKFWNKGIDNYNPRSIGLPQTEFGDQSRLLANFYLQNYDNKISEVCREFEAEYIRYADDQIIFLRDKTNLKSIIFEISNKLNNLGLNLNASKTKLLAISELAEYNCYKSHDLLDKGEYDESANLFIDTYKKGSDIRSDTYLKRIINNKIGLNKFNEINKNKLIELLINENFLLSCSKNDLYKIYTQFIEKNEKIRLLEVLFIILENTKFNGIHIAIKSMIVRIKKDENDPDILHKLNQIELIEL